jgi:hypothetical protein
VVSVVFETQELQWQNWNKIKEKIVSQIVKDNG